MRRAIACSTLGSLRRGMLASSQLPQAQSTPRRKSLLDAASRPVDATPIRQLAAADAWATIPTHHRCGGAAHRSRHQRSVDHPQTEQMATAARCVSNMIATPAR